MTRKPADSSGQGAAALKQALQQAGALHGQGRLAEAEMAYRAILARSPNDFNALHLLGLLRMQQGQLADAVHYLSAAVNSKPDAVEALSNLGTILARLGRHSEALANLDRVLALKPRDAEAHFSRAVVLGLQGRLEEALASYEQVLAARPNDVMTWSNRGKILFKLKHYSEALASVDRALAFKSDLAEAWSGRGDVFFERKQHEEALAAFDKALTCKNDFAEAWNGRASVCCELKRYEESLAAFDKALMFNPQQAEAWHGRGNLLLELRRFDESLEAFDKALMFNPRLAESWNSRGNLFLELKRYEEALVSYNKALAIKPDLKYLAGTHLHTKMILCDWNDFDNECAQLTSAVQAGRPASTPMSILAIPSSVKNHLECARTWTTNNCPTSAERLWQGERYAHDRIRIAYLSPDFRNHPVAHLLASLFEQHDHARFETIAISVGPDDQSEMRARLQGAFERFIDVRDKSDLEAARVIRELEVDILVDLMGSFALARPAILAFRPAPIQVNYLSYPGIVGADYIDYIMADPFVIPEEERAQYSESVVYLPDTYLGYDTKRKISERMPGRAELGLPETGFVFCVYNNSYKITPHMFDIWMRLLREVEGSVLWLYRENAFMVNNLRREAQARGVDPERLIFAPFVKQFEDHLARYRVVDLFLDALPFNAVTTACDALWAGLPILTCRGDVFLSRVSTSLLHAVGLSELVTTNLADYEALALKLAREPALLAEIKAKLARNRETYPLFNTERFTRHIEAAYITMWDRWQRGEAPQSFSVAPITS